MLIPYTLTGGLVERYSPLFQTHLFFARQLSSSARHRYCLFISPGWFGVEKEDHCGWNCLWWAGGLFTLFMEIDESRPGVWPCCVLWLKLPLSRRGGEDSDSFTFCISNLFTFDQNTVFVTVGQSVCEDACWYLITTRRCLVLYGLFSIASDGWLSFCFLWL